VLVSFSTTFQDQDRIVARCIRALAHLRVRGLVTVGPAIDMRTLPRAPNVTVVESVSHDEVMPYCAAVICHAGHGTVVRPLMHGVPIVCLPTGRDQPENAARVAWRGAGIRLSPKAGVRRIRAATARVLSEPSFRRAAQNLGEAIRAESDGGAGAAQALTERAYLRRRSWTAPESGSSNEAARHDGGPNRPRAPFENP
jgi:UDP:flavonoid glycosyltransferase YjiC (YdhE family)